MARSSAGGDNSFGQLGQGDVTQRGDGPGEMGDDLPAIDLGTGRTAVSLVAGRSHACARLDNGAVKCWGQNFYGQLGLGDTFYRGDELGEMGDALPAVDLGTGRTALSLALGANHTCARLDNGTVKCWGLNFKGQLGLGDDLRRGDASGEMDDNLPAVDLGTGRTAVSLITGDSHTCALLDDDTVKCWGQNSRGQLGLGDSLDRGDLRRQMGDDLRAVDLGTGRTAVSIAAGGDHTCAILDDGQVKCWGNNFFGQLGLGHLATIGDGLNEMGDFLPPVSLGSRFTAVSLSAGENHTCALLNNGAIKCWGYNEFGQLGLEDSFLRGLAPETMGDNLSIVTLGTLP